MAVEGRTQYDISQFNITREEIQNPDTKNVFYLGSEVEAKLWTLPRGNMFNSWDNVEHALT